MILAAWYHIILAVIFAGMATFLMLIVLLQRGKGVGLAGAFGGAGGQTVFGSKTGDILTWATVVVAGVFMLFTILLNYVFVPQSAGLSPPVLTAPAGPAGADALPETPLDEETIPAPAPAETPAAEAATPAPAPSPAAEAAPESGGQAEPAPPPPSPATP
jgi:preprotein translocase subunit SecG